MLISEITDRIGIWVENKEEGDKLISLLSTKQVEWQYLGPVKEGNGIKQEVLYPLIYVLKRLPDTTLQLSWIMYGWEEKSGIKDIVNSKEFISQNQ